MTDSRSQLSVEVAVLVSVLLHVASLGAYQHRAELARWSLFRPVARLVRALLTPPARPSPRAPAVVPTITFVAEPAPPETAPAPKPARAEPHIFVETDARQPAGQPPPDTLLYSDRATVAANPVNPTGRTGATPYLEGKGSKVLSSEDVPRLTTSLPSAPAGHPEPRALPSLTTPVAKELELPDTPPPRPAINTGADGATPSIAAEATPATGGPRPGGAESVRKEEPPKPLAEFGVRTEPPQPPVPPKPAAQPAAADPSVTKLALAELGGQPRTTAEFRPLAPAAPPPPITQQPVPIPPAATAVPASPGGRSIAAVRSRLVAAGIDRQGLAAFNVASSPFGEYDKRLIRAVQSKWLRLVEEYDTTARPGTVALSFQLYPDGRVGNLHRQENSAGEILALYCEKAILDNVPFDPLPESLQVLIGRDARDVSFTFYY